MTVPSDPLSGVEGFEWDAGNADKNWRRHEVRQTEAEQVLLNMPLVVKAPARQAGAEPRFIALGQTDTGRLLTVIFTVRRSRIRVISARPMSRRERNAHGKVEAKPETDSRVRERS